MTAHPLTAADVGTELPPLALPPLTRSTLALYAGGSGDHVPLHIDQDFVRRAGYPDVFMHGMLGMAYLGRLLTAWAPQEAIKEFSVRFVAITYPGEALTCYGKVVSKGLESHPNAVRVDLALKNADGEPKLTGHAILELPPE